MKEAVDIAKSVAQEAVEGLTARYGRPGAKLLGRELPIETRRKLQGLKGLLEYLKKIYEFKSKKD